MIVHAIVAVVFLALPAVVPVVALVGLRPVTLFLLPLAGAVLAAVAVEFELAAGGSFLTWFAVLGVLSNAVAVWRWRSVTSRIGAPFIESSLWAWLTVVAVIGAVAWSLQALRGPVVFDDGYAIWILHAVFIYGGHHVLLSDLQNPLYQYSHPEYPPLVPAGGALAFVSAGSADIRLAVIVTSVLNACGLGVVACGIGEVARHRGPLTRSAALGIAGLLCLIGFGLAGAFAFADYADLLWAAAAVGALVFGLVLPRAPRHLAVAWLCATAASLTKSEGLTASLMIFVLLSIRYLPAPQVASPSDSSTIDDAAVTADTHLHLGSALSDWIPRAALVCVMAAPGIVWVALVRLAGINGTFFVGLRQGTINARVNPTVTYLTHDLHILPVAAAVAIVGSLALPSRRSRLGLASPMLLWIVVVGYVAALAFTYVVGKNPIHHWLTTSAGRTTIFANLALYTDLAIWLVVAVSGDERIEPGAAPESVDEDVEAPLAPT